MFITAFILNLLSSYFLASVFRSVLIIFISFFALVIINMEVLSLFSAINDINILIFSVLNLIFAFAIFKIKKSEFLKPKLDFKRLKNSFLLDKSLIALLVGFLILNFVNLFLAATIPVIEPDSQTYHFLRAYEFVRQQSLNHFETNDIRALVMPINSEIFYSWMLALKKNFHGYGILSYFSYILVIFSMWDIFEKFKYSYRKRLYAIFIFSSLAAIIIQMPSLQTDICVGACLISAFALFIKKNYYFSSLVLALAMGVKSTGIIALIGFFALILLYKFFIENDKKISNLKAFFLFLILNFVIFSSYNYILNYIDFSNPLSNKAAYMGHSFWGGFKGYIANLIHFSFQSLDFTGFKWGYYLNNKILFLKESFFNFINIDPKIGCNFSQDKVNIIADEQIVGFGILGFLVFLPTVFVSLFKPIKLKNKKVILSSLLALTFLINILMLARSVAYMIFSTRFIVAFVCLSSIILINVYSKKNLVKKALILFFCLFYMILLSTHNMRMPFFKIFNHLKEVNFNLENFEKDCYEGKILRELGFSPVIKKTIEEKYSNKKNIALIKNLSSSALYLKKLEYKGYNIDFLVAGKINNEKLKKYDLIILETQIQNDNVFNPEDIEINYKIENSNVIFNNNDSLNCYYVYTKTQDEQVYRDDAIERICFTYPYLSKQKDFKLDYSEEFFNKEYKLKENIYYFIKQIND